ncbi:MAG TPA: MogA/MoaB family molybdenum cofactor biosynthesis protein [Candidatus Acidoferrales bacterium]|nr:MogA/MoaB family molybdenum cofactor biosynthesis protein [Candidatus Acidoferrales bacterium]
MRVAIVTVSDSSFTGAREDSSGPAVRERCAALGWQIASAEILPDDQLRLTAKLAELADSSRCDCVLTTGGTGIGPRDVTPEATMNICERLIPGLAELMRTKGLQFTPRSVLSRAVVGVRSGVMIVNLPGSPKGAVQSLDAIADLLPHACEVIRGAKHD